MLIKDIDSEEPAFLPTQRGTMEQLSTNTSAGAAEDEPTESQQREDKGKGKQEESKLEPIIIDGGCQCSLLRYRITIPAEFQNTEFYQKYVGFSHCYCHSCRTAVSALTQTSLAIPKEMIQWATRAKLIDAETESEDTSSSRRGSKGKATDESEEAESFASPTPQKPEEKSIPAKVETAPIRGRAKPSRLRSPLKSIPQDVNSETDFINIDTPAGCCCYVNNGAGLRVSTTNVPAQSSGGAESTPEPGSYSVHDDAKTRITTDIGVHAIPEDGKPCDTSSSESRRPSVGRSWSGNAGYHRQIWKRQRGVGGKETSGTAEAAAPALPKTATQSPNETSEQSTVEDKSIPVEPTREATKDKGKGKAKESLWSRLSQRGILRDLIENRKKAKESGVIAKVKGKATAAVSSKDKGKGKSKDQEPTTKNSEGDVISPESTLVAVTQDSEMASASRTEEFPEPPSYASAAGNDASPPETQTQTSPSAPSRLEILRWETQLLHQQRTDLSQDTDEQGFEAVEAPPLCIPWPYKEFSRTTREGRLAIRGFCSWCGGSLTFRNNNCVMRGVVDIQAGSMDDIEAAMRKVGFLREYCCDKALPMEVGGRLGTSAGHVRDATVERLQGCDNSRGVYIDREDVAEFHEEGEFDV